MYSVYLRQQLALQALLSLPPELGQAFPPQLGTRPVQERVLDMLPPPHFLEQLVQEVQEAHRPSTARGKYALRSGVVLVTLTTTVSVAR